MSEPNAVYAARIHHPGDDFVSHPFHFVVLVSLGLVRARSLAVDRLVSGISFFYLVCSTALQTKAAAWRGVPAAKANQSDVSEYLVFSLASSISLLIFSSSVCKLIYKLSPTDIRSLSVKWIGFGIMLCLLNLLLDGTEQKTLGPITNDQSIYFYIYASRIIEGIRATLQVYIMLPRVWTQRTAPLKKKTHQFLFSLLILGQNVQEITSYGPNCYSIFDILLQLCVVLKTWKHAWTKTLLLCDRFLSIEKLITFLASVKSMCSSTISKLAVQTQRTLDWVSAAGRGMRMSHYAFGVPRSRQIVTSGCEWIHSTTVSFVTTSCFCLMNWVRNVIQLALSVGFLAWIDAVYRFLVRIVRECPICWLRNLHIHQEQDRNLEQAIVVWVDDANCVHYVPYNRLANRIRMLDRRKRYVIHVHREPEPVLGEDFPSSPKDESVEDIVGSQALCNLETNPLEATS